MREAPGAARGEGPLRRADPEPDHGDASGGELRLPGLPRRNRARQAGPTRHRDVQPLDAHATEGGLLRRLPRAGGPRVDPRRDLPSRAQSMTACFTCHDGTAQPNACAYCHTAPHPNRGPCQDCHNLKSWVPGNFHHPVPLIGPHAALLCEQCHTSPTAGTMGPADGCVNCHGDHHNSTLLLSARRATRPRTSCPRRSSTSRSDRTSRRRPTAAMRDCHTQTLATATCSCHGGNPPRAAGDDGAASDGTGAVDGAERDHCRRGLRPNPADVAVASLEVADMSAGDVSAHAEVDVRCSNRRWP